MSDLKVGQSAATTVRERAQRGEPSLAELRAETRRLAGADPIQIEPKGGEWVDQLIVRMVAEAVASAAKGNPRAAIHEFNGYLTLVARPVAPELAAAEKVAVRAQFDTQKATSDREVAARDARVRGEKQAGFEARGFKLTDAPPPDMRFDDAPIAGGVYQITDAQLKALPPLTIIKSAISDQLRVIGLDVVPGEPNRRGYLPYGFPVKAVDGYQSAATQRNDSQLRGELAPQATQSPVAADPTAALWDTTVKPQR